MIRRLRHQLAAYSPLPVRGVFGALLADVAGVAAAARLRHLLQERYRADVAALLGSGTMALQLALDLAVEGRGAEAIALPAFGCFQLASAAVWVAERRNVRVRLYDVDAATLAPDWPSLESALAHASVAVVAPLFGIPLDWHRVMSIARRYGVTIIEDAAQGHGASWHGAPLGSWGDLAVLSFGRGKGWTGIAGGALLARGEWSQSVAAAPVARAGVRRRAGHAAAMLAQWTCARPSLYALPAAIPALGLGETRYVNASAPASMGPGARALIAASLAAADREAAVRRATAHEWRERLDGVGGLFLFDDPENGTAGYLRFPLLLPGGLAALADPAGARRLGMAASYPSTLAALPAIRALCRDAGHWPGAEALVRDLVTLPTHGRLSADDRDRVLQVLASVASSARTPASLGSAIDSLPVSSESCAESRAS